MTSSHFSSITSPKTASMLEKARQVFVNGSFKKSFLVFSGPSGAGKSTLLNRLFRDFPTTFGFSVSHTTRKPRSGEVDGVDYNYVTEEVFKSLISTNSFLEYANFSGNWYGTSWSSIKKIVNEDKICILDVDLAGVKSIKSHLKSDSSASSEDARFIFVRPVCKLNLETRLRNRGSESEESLSRRLSRVDGDFEYADQPGNYDLILVNDEFDSAYCELVKFIFEIK